MDFSSIITKENYNCMCYTNRDLIKGEIKGVATQFHGYCGTDYRRSPKRFDEILAENGIVTLYPFYGPFAWSNDTAIKTIDRLIQLTYEINNISPENTPLVITGASMGGMTALAYTYYSAFNPIACAVDCPVTNLKKIIEMRKDIYRAMVTAFGHYNCTMDEAMASVSPIELAPKMPKIPYYLIAGTNDCEVEYTEHCMKYVPRMRELGFDIEFKLVDGMEHCCMSEANEDIFCNFIIKNIEENR